MARPRTTKSTPRKPAAASESSESIAEQTRRFLESGNKVEVISSGISGKPTLGANKPQSPRGNS